MTRDHALDDIDRKIVAALLDDGRLPLAGLAKRVGVARSTVQVRVARLEAAGVIAGYTARLGPAGPRGVAAYVHVTVDAKRGDRVVDDLGAVEAVRELHAVSGDADLLALVQAPTPEELDEVLDRIGRLPGVVRTDTSVVLRTRLRRAPLW